MTIKARLTIYNAAVIGLLFLIFSISVYQSLSWRLLASARETVQESMSRVSENIANSASFSTKLFRGVDKGVYVAVRGRDGEIIITSIGSAQEDQQGGDTLWRQAFSTSRAVMGTTDLSPQAPDFAIAKRMLISGKTVVVEVANPIGDSLDAVATLRSILLIAGVLFVVVSLAGGYAMAYVSFRPVGRLSAVAEKISSQNLGERLPVRNSHDEIGRLTIVLNELLSRLEVSFNTQRRFVSDAAHELATPLSGIRGAIGILKTWGAAKPEVRRETIDMIDTDSRRLVDLVDKLLTLGTLDETPPLQAETFNLQACVRELVDALVTSERKDFVELELSAEILVYADLRLFENLMMILIDNALKHSGPEEKVRISAVAKEGGVNISVTDNGVGISAEDLPHIFDRFYRGDKARGRQTGGSGLGLSIAKSIVEAHGGRILARSEPGKGATVEFWLPNQAERQM